LTGGKTKEYEKAEKALLKKELSKQGISSERSAAVLSCLTASGCKNNAGSANPKLTGMAGFLDNIKARVIATGESFIGIKDKLAEDLYNAYNTPNIHTYVNKLRTIGRSNSIIDGSSGAGKSADSLPGVMGTYDRELAKNQVKSDSLAADYEI